MAGTAGVLVSACGGGGSSGYSPPPRTPTDVPSPTPTPPPPPPAGQFNTAEYRRSNAATHIGAITAYEEGAHGAGIKIGVVDSGIDVDSAEFSGRVDPLSRDVAAFRGIDDRGGHGTSVTAVAAAARNDSGMHGVAPEVVIVVARADEPGSCGDEDGCTYPDRNIARGVDLAVDAGARVINISLGGSAAASSLMRAIDRATAAGTVIVISAGNDGEANPDPLALAALSREARGRVLIAGSVDATNIISDFSNQAGVGAQHYLVTLGDRVRSFDENGTAFLYSGTSYAAPGVVGALALLFSAFPNLTADQAIAIIKDTAVDLGAAGIDDVYGNGLLDLRQAFEPQGGLSIAGTSMSAAPQDPLVTTGGAAGDAAKFGGALAGVVALDSYDRAFEVDISSSLRSSPARGRLAGALLSHAGGGAARVGAAELGFATQQGALALAGSNEERDLDVRGGTAPILRRGYVEGAPAEGVSVAAAYGYAPDELNALANGVSAPSPAYLAQAGALDAEGIAAQAGLSAAVERGALRISAAAAGGKAYDGLAGEALGGVRRLRFDIARQFPGASVSLGWEHLREEGSFLGSRGSQALGVGGARSDFVTAGGQVDVGGAWQLRAEAKAGVTQLETNGGLASGAGGLTATGFALGLSKPDAFAPGDMFGVQLSQPLRFESGRIDLSVPAGWDYAAEAPVLETRALRLSPSGRELALEAAYSRPFAGGSITANGFYRHQPGHSASAPADIGVALRLQRRF